MCVLRAYFGKACRDLDNLYQLDSSLVVRLSSRTGGHECETPITHTHVTAATTFRYLPTISKCTLYNHNLVLKGALKTSLPRSRQSQLAS